MIYKTKTIQKSRSNVARTVVVVIGVLCAVLVIIGFYVVYGLDNDWTLSSWRYLDGFRLVYDLFLLLLLAMAIFIILKLRNITWGAAVLKGIFVLLFGLVIFAFMQDAWGIGKDLRYGTASYIGPCAVRELPPSNANRHYTYELYTFGGLKVAPFSISRAQFNDLSGLGVNRERSIVSRMFSSKKYPCVSDIEMQVTFNSKHVLSLRKISH